jgi:HlyD family secretion protein
MLRGCLLALGGVALVLPAATAADAPATYRVKGIPFKLEAKLEGTFESTATAEVRFEPKRWASFVVRSAVPHGTRVGKGDVVIQLETDKIDEAIRDLELSDRLAELAHGLVQQEVRLLEKATPLQLEAARRAQRIAAEDLKRYEENEEPLAREGNEWRLKVAERQLENAEEELAQLEQMYEQDELTEETEEIVLKRARFSAEIARFNETVSRDDHERNVLLDLPRRLEFVRRVGRVAALELEAAEHGIPVALAKARLELEKSVNDRRKAKEQLAEIKADREHMAMKAPIDGIVYYGKWRQGKWVESDTAAGRLRPAATLVDPKDAAMTIIGGGRLALRASVPEKDLTRVPAGASARVIPKAFGDLRLPARVRSISAVPVGPGRFEAVIDMLEEHPRLMASMEAEVRVTAERKVDALAIPRKAVFTDDFDDDQRYVYVTAGAGKEPMKRPVAVGRGTDELLEITAGLSLGEEILLEKPGTAAKPAAAAEPPKQAEPAKPAAPAATPPPAKPEPPKQEAAKPEAPKPAPPAAPPAPPTTPDAGKK